MGRKGQPPDRIATCCYCGSRSILPSGGRRERLVCHGCGAPIRVLEILGARDAPGRRPAVPHPAERPGAHQAKDRAVRRKKGKRKPGLIARLGRVLDDLDDILDIFD
ncbi:hypothetical protein H0I76_05440 [Limibaculum sp. M0105]|uniref:Uncharacterized protein n=1 Tax=Thermohalobaculum xanthum TaxID=2753746 RepID=A0A8J7SDT7_9RHOB|nr:hypothetical protein [Thermohalobaculum xanthum]MBK0398622.1 hypothetical protein [Thermohalobaculum xanthum]